MPRTWARPHRSVTVPGPGSSFRHRGTRVRPVLSPGLRASAGTAPRGKEQGPGPARPGLSPAGEVGPAPLLSSTGRGAAAPAPGPSEAKRAEPFARAQLTTGVSETERRTGVHRARALGALCASASGALCPPSRVCQSPAGQAEETSGSRGSGGDPPQGETWLLQPLRPRSPSTRQPQALGPGRFPARQLGLGTHPGPPLPATRL